MAIKKESKDKPEAVANPGGQNADAAPAEKAAAAAPAEEINVDDFGRLVASMSRLLVGFGQLKPLREAGLGLGEWVALGMLARQEGATIKLMSRNLGVPVQRVSQITGSLTQSGLISVGQTTEAESQGAKAGKVIKVTDAGKAKLEAINGELKSVLGGMMKARTLSAALKRMAPLGRGLRAVNTEKVGKKKGKKAKQAAAASEAQAASSQS
ncbi:MarR family winged helix-turn-helix transcriptional regulator [Reyranella sp.]|uniref:MarR family winged helix-turn-helix transcriptional regulator n=1 Tax=Reyranella sp. TaxID=1929291 RepID=UPI0027194EF7|nr:MarR family winged helix-turn-helix transcriptional regulator [Reyranella sp.]MDO8972363.1 MarR family winged helix-turn-helix transcriptional regulator [Reyranella sp.]